MEYQIKSNQSKAESMQQQSHLAGPDRGRSETAAKRELEETWKARWTRYQQQTCTVANDNKLSVAVRATWTSGLRTKENLTRAESTVATLLRTVNIGLNDYLCRRRVPGYLKPDCECGWPRQTPKHINHICLRDQRRTMTQILGNDAWELRYWGSAETAPRW
jgi:hypothetical protein